ncbi:DUF6901 family protein [Rugamonas sp. CCM 8940]|uniref:DUF6901 family protein n=1 Tax=Rugamonas sp. CCM 8940 TaxID=2765359 RepID=UPI0018F46914|nr:hypothetical protein [Rugamonas sp. CCM 8940]MBJ7312138.1 hypothetical protein [Rugamonas sp. CCM 8940]
MQNVLYHFRFADGRSAALGNAKRPAADAATLPDWTRLDFHQCPNCPLTPHSTPHCPMAADLVELVQTAGALSSYEEVEVRVETAERNVDKRTTVQRAAGALMGLLAAGSDCPHVAFLKPMAHFHLPFATAEENLYRVVSSYLLAQYLRQQAGLEADWALAGLKRSSEAMQVVNAAMAERLRAAARKDGAINALVLLDLLAKALPYSIDEQMAEIKILFAAQLDGAAAAP